MLLLKQIYIFLEGESPTLNLIKGSLLNGLCQVNDKNDNLKKKVFSESMLLNLVLNKVLPVVKHA